MENKLVRIFDKKFANPHNTISGPTSGFSVEDFLLLNKVLNGTEGFLVVFNNGGGKAFSIWEWENEEKLKTFIEMEFIKPFVFGYRIGDVDTVIKTI